VPRWQPVTYRITCRRLRPLIFFSGADRFGPPQGDPPVVPVYRGNQLQGFVYLNSDFTNTIGYSGKPINLLVGIDSKGVITGIKLVDHSEPIVLVGIPEARIVAAMNALIGNDMKPVARGSKQPPQVDIVSGATVTVLVMGESVVRSAVRLIRAGRIAAEDSAAVATAPPHVSRTVDLDHSEIRDWASLVGDGSVRRLHLTIGDVNEAFAKWGNAAAAQSPEPGETSDTFIDLYVALVSVPTIGRSLLGEQGYQQLSQRLQPAQQAIVVAGCVLVQRLGLCTRRHLRSDRAPTGGDEYPLPRQEPCTIGLSRRRWFALSSRSIQRNRGSSSCWSKEASVRATRHS
jgi:NosR/NirI family nitrous oxide reductase transcriptional regulator